MHAYTASYIPYKIEVGNDYVNKHYEKQHNYFKHIKSHGSKA